MKATDPSQHDWERAAHFSALRDQSRVSEPRLTRDFESRKHQSLIAAVFANRPAYTIGLDPGYPGTYRVERLIPDLLRRVMHIPIRLLPVGLKNSMDPSMNRSMNRSMNLSMN